MMEKKITVFTDGGARGNPGPAAIAFVIKNEEGETIKEQGVAIGRATNNVAEYKAILEAVKWLAENQITIADRQTTICLFSDSKLIINQLNGLYKIKNKELQKLAIGIKKIISSTDFQFNFYYIPREKNRQSDFLVNKTLNFF